MSKSAKAVALIDHKCNLIFKIGEDGIKFKFGSLLWLKRTGFSSIVSHNTAVVSVSRTFFVHLLAVKKHSREPLSEAEVNVRGCERYKKQKSSVKSISFQCDVRIHLHSYAFRSPSSSVTRFPHFGLEGSLTPIWLVCCRNKLGEGGKVLTFSCYCHEDLSSFSQHTAIQRTWETWSEHWRVC